MSGARVFLLVCVLWLAFAHGAAQAAPGDVDGSFSRGGLLAVDRNPSSFAVQPDGGVLTLDARRQNLTVTRYSARGRLDRSFGVRGRTRIPGPAGAEGRVASADVAVDADGTVVVAGFVTTGEDPSTWFFARLLADGSLDPSFGAGGVAAATIPAYRLRSMALDSERRIVAAGSRASFENRGSDIVRLLPNGELDPTFSGDGMQYVHTILAAAVATSDDSVVASGYPTSGARSHESLGVVRLRPDGGLDPSFGDGGFAATTTRLPSPVSPRRFSLVIDPTQRVLVGLDGFGADLGPGPVYFHGSSVIALRADGSDDLGFGEEGAVEHLGGALAQGDDGSLFAGGARSPGSGYPAAASVTKLTSDGAVDRTYAHRGSAFAYDEQLRGSQVLQLEAAPDGTLTGLANGLVRFEAGPGPADADGDRVLDDEDRCDLLPSRNRAGCPQVSRTASLYRNDRGLSVRLTARVPGCELGERIRLLSRMHGRDIVEARTRTDRARQRRVVFRGLRPGRYYAAAPKHFDAGFGHCERVRSRSIAIR